MRDFSHIQTIQDYYNEFFKIRSNRTNEEMSRTLAEYTDCRFIAKLYTTDENGGWKYVDSIITPTEYYPLSDKSFRIFHSGNCKATTDPTVISCFDSVKHIPGHCYSMADELHDKLNKCGIPSTIWCGWHFVSNRPPIHHCWVTVGENSETLLDIQENCDHIAAILQGHSFNSDEEYRIFLADTLSSELKRGVKNSEKCAPLGIPSHNVFYVGSRVSSGDAARKIYNDLTKKYPDHPNARNLYNNGMTPFQKMVYDRI